MVSVTAKCQGDSTLVKRLPFAAGLRGLGALGLDAAQQGGGGFIAGVLGDEVAGEGFFQDGLAQGFGAGEGGVDLGFERAGGFEFSSVRFSCWWISHSP